jgi:hypothetical protein
MCMWKYRRIAFCGEKMTHLLNLGDGLIVSVEEDGGKYGKEWREYLRMSISHIQLTSFHDSQFDICTSSTSYPTHST